MLEGVVARAVVTATADGLVDEVEGLDLAAAGLHHALDPLVHGIDEGVVHLFLGLGDGLLHVALKLDAADESVAYVVGHVEQDEVGVHRRLDGHFHVLPLCGEGDAEIGAAAPVAQTAVELSFLGTLDGHRHLIVLVSLKDDIVHRHKLHLPGIGFRGCHLQAVGSVELVGEAILRFVVIGFPANALSLAEILAGDEGVDLFAIGVGLVSEKLQQPALGLL